MPIAQPGKIIIPEMIQPFWQTFSPVVYTNMASSPTAIVSTTQYARYARLGDTVWAHASVVVGASTSGGVGIRLPVPAADRFLNIGTLVLMGSSTPSDQSGIAFMAPGYTSLLVVVAYTTGNRDATSGQTLRYSVCYEAAPE